MAASNATPKLTTKPEKTTRTTVDTIQFDRKLIASWELPPFQRPETLNNKVRMLAEQIKADGGVLPGVLTLGVFQGKTFLIDGQHRRASWLLSGLSEGFCDLRVQYFNSLADMADAFVALNSRLVVMRPDDILRGLEPGLTPIASIRERCPFVGYDLVRRSEKAPIVSMSLTLRAWSASSNEVPSNSSGLTAAQLASTLQQGDADQLVNFLRCGYQGWGRDPEYARLWGGLNLTLCMWLYRRTVIEQYSHKTPKLTKEGFTKCLMTLSASSTYLDWLVGRHNGERDRSPAFARIRAAFAERILKDTGTRALMPAPPWFLGRGA